MKKKIYHMVLLFCMFGAFLIGTIGLGNVIDDSTIDYQGVGEEELIILYDNKVFSSLDSRGARISSFWDFEFSEGREIIHVYYGLKDVATKKKNAIATKYIDNYGNYFIKKRGTLYVDSKKIPNYGENEIVQLVLNPAENDDRNQYKLVSSSKDIEALKKDYLEASKTNLFIPKDSLIEQTSPEKIWIGLKYKNFDAINWIGYYSIYETKQVSLWLEGMKSSEVYMVSKDSAELLFNHIQ